MAPERLGRLSRREVPARQLTRTMGISGAILAQKGSSGQFHPLPESRRRAAASRWVIMVSAPGRPSVARLRTPAAQTCPPAKAARVAPSSDYP